jgi:hypothetical protein
MCSSSRPRCRRRTSRGVTILELVLAVAIFAVAMVPILQVITDANRTSYSADRYLRASVHAQMILDALVALDASELPPVPVDGATLLLDEGQVASGGAPRWLEVVAFLAQPPPFEGMERRIQAERYGDPGKTTFEVRLRWRRLGHVEGSWVSLTMRGVSNPKEWR